MLKKCFCLEKTPSKQPIKILENIKLPFIKGLKTVFSNRSLNCSHENEKIYLTFLSFKINP